MPTIFRSILMSLAVALAIAPAATFAQSVTRASVASNIGQQMTVYLTGYSYWDNTPPGSAAIAKPVIHRRAGGRGTYNNPITLAVGHSLNGRRQTLDFPAGTRFYFPQLRKYAIVEDVCGDGPRPQNGPCHTGRNGLPWVDIYVDGKRAGNRVANSCMNRITGFHKVVLNPGRNLPVTPGPLAESGCPMF